MSLVGLAVLVAALWGSPSWAQDLGDAGVHEPAVRELAAEGVLDGTGCGEGLLCPGEPVERWEVAVWLVRVLDGAAPADLEGSRFDDVGADVWWSPYVERLADLRVTRGCRTEPLSFCPGEAVSRAQMASFLVRAFELPAARPAGFGDVDGVHEENIDRLAAARVTRGCSTDPLLFCPYRDTTRAQMASFLVRAAAVEPAVEPDDEQPAGGGGPTGGGGPPGGEGPTDGPSPTPLEEPQPPPAPSGVGAAATSVGFELSWDAGSELGHELRYRSAGVEEWLAPVAVDAGSTFFAVARLQPGASYEVQLRAVDRDGLGSPWTPVRPLPVRAGLAPDPVESVLAMDSPPDGIKVSWSAPAELGSGVSGYRVEWTGRRPAGSGFTAQADHEVPAERTGYVIGIAQLEKGALYWMRVVAFNPVGDGEPSEIVQAMATSAPGPVTGLRAEADDAQLALGWALPRDSGGTAVTGYGIRYRRSGDSWQPWPHDGTAASAVVTGLINGLTYELSVRAANDVGYGPWSSASAVPSLVALQPTGAAATAAAGGRGLRVSWTPPAKSGRERYEVSWQPEPGQLYTGARQQTDVAATERSVVLSGLVAGVEYRVRVEAHFDDGTTGSSPDMVAAPRPAQARLAAPAGVGFSVDPADRSVAEVAPQLPVSLIVVSAAPPATPAQAVMLFRELQWKPQDAASYQDPVRVDSDSQTVDGFALGQAYDLRLRAWNLDGPGAWSITERVLVAFAPDPPVLGSPSAADEQMALSWDPPSFTGGVPLTGYAVQYRPAGGEWQDHPHSGTAAGTVVGSLGNGRRYQARVAAVNAAGAGEWSATVEAMPRWTPGFPRVFKTVGQSYGGDGQIRFYWRPPSNDRGATIDDGGLTIESYQTGYKPSNAETDFTPGPTIIPETTDGPDTEYETTIRGLTNGVNYLVRVIAVNNLGPGTPGTFWTTPRGPPGEPRNLELTPDDGRIKVSWQPPSHDGATIHDGGAAIETYRVEWKADTDAEFTRGRTVRPRSNDGVDTTYEKTLSGLVNGVTYDVRVTATNTHGTGPGTSAQATALSEADQVRQLVEGHATTYESDWPWLRAATDHVDTSGGGLEFLPDRGSLRGRVLLRCPNSGRGLGRCELESFGVRRRARASTVIHELAHVYTQINHVEEDPGTVAIAWLYIANTYGDAGGDPRDCRIDELVADALTDTVLPDIEPSELSYWYYCRPTGRVGLTAEEYDVFGAAVSGRVPDWFIDTYGGDKDDKAAVWTEDYTGDSAAVWADVLKLPENPRVAVVSKLRNFFGGYCTQEIAKAAAFSDSGLASPWAHGGCEPDPPTAVAVSRGATSLTVSWAPPDSMRGGAITHYIVQWKSADPADNEDYPGDTAGFGAAARQVRITDLDTLSYEITGLTAGDAHHVRVLAVNATHSSDWVEARGTVAVATPPTQYRLGGLLTAIEVSWAPPADNGGSAVTSYVVQWKATGVDEYSETERRAVITDLTDLSHTIEDLTTGQSHTVRVRAVTALGNGEPAEASAVPGSPGELQDVRVDPGSCDTSEESYLNECTFSFTVLWDPPTQGAGLVTGYDIQWRRPGGRWGQDADGHGSVTLTDGAATSHVLEPTGLSETVEARIRPLGGDLPGPWSNVQFRPGKPTALQNASITYDADAGQFNYSWEPPRFTGGGPIVEYYLVLEDCTDGCFGIGIGQFFVSERLGPEARSHTIDRRAASGSEYLAKMYATADGGSRRVSGPSTSVYLEF